MSFKYLKIICYLIKHDDCIVKNDSRSFESLKLWVDEQDNNFLGVDR